jgi:single-strand DNA-binding protein
MNSVNLIGNLTRDPELKDTKSETSVCSIRLAVNARGENVDYFDVTAFGKLAETIAEHLAKGRQIGVSGRLSSSEWEAEDGSKRSRVEVIAQDVRFLGSKPNGNGEAAEAQAEKDPLDDF